MAQQETTAAESEKQAKLAQIDKLVGAIGHLSRAERLALYRRLSINGLLDREEIYTDQNPLRIATAVQPKKPSTTLHKSLTLASKDAAESSRPSARLGDGQATAQSQQGDGDEGYRSPVRGRVVVGSPESGPEPPPLAMQPLPGQAPDRPIRIIFDGGSKGNPGRGYGSYAMEWPGFPRQLVRLRFGDMVTNNEAEYDTLIAAIEAVLKRLAENGADPSSAQVEIWGDSQLVINQINGEWKAKKSEMQVRRDQARALLARFGSYRLRYHSRDNSVEVLGH